MHGANRLRTLVAAAAALAAVPLTLARSAEGEMTIESLVKGGWQVAGYTSTADNRSTLILFKHPTEAYLVQCRAGFDVTRSPPTYSTCYELH